MEAATRDAVPTKALTVGLARGPGGGEKHVPPGIPILQPSFTRCRWADSPGIIIRPSGGRHVVIRHTTGALDSGVELGDVQGRPDELERRLRELAEDG
jgi:hypothetical protein